MRHCVDVIDRPLLFWLNRNNLLPNYLSKAFSTEQGRTYWLGIIDQIEVEGELLPEEIQRLSHCVGQLADEGLNSRLLNHWLGYDWKLTAVASNDNGQLAS